MRAKDLMTTRVVTVTPETPVRDIAALLLEQHISGVPVIDPARRVIGMIGESDLIHRIAARSGQRRSWWHSIFGASEDDPAEFIRVHGLRAEDIMTRDVVTVTEDTPVEDIARILEERRIRRVPVVSQGKLVGLISRADLLRLVVVAPPEATVPVSVDDRELRERIMAALAKEPWAHTSHLSVVVTDGVVHLWGSVYSDPERKALRVAAEEVPGVKRVEDHLTRISPANTWE